MESNADLINLAVVYSLDGAAIVANLLLIVVIARRTPPSMKAYAVILLHNALIDLFSASASAFAGTRVISKLDGTVVLVYLGRSSMLEDAKLCHACQTAHMAFVIQSIGILLISFVYRLQVIRNSAVHVQSILRVWMMCSISYLPTALFAYLYYFCARATPHGIKQELGVVRYLTACLSLTELPAFLSVSFITIFSPIVIITVFFVRRRLLSTISQASASQQAQHKCIARALTYQMLLPGSLTVASALSMFAATGVYPAEWPQRMIMISSSFFALASPIITLVHLPPYRRVFVCKRMKTKTPEQTHSANANKNIRQ